LLTYWLSWLGWLGWLFGLLWLSGFLASWLA
jgi:hypothetical protein